MTAANVPVDQRQMAVGENHLRPQFSRRRDESFVGGYRMDIAPSGAITIRYDYAPSHAKGRFSEAGLSIVLPSEITEFRWIGQLPELKERFLP